MAALATVVPRGTFWCQRSQGQIDEEACHLSFLDAHALKQSERPCWGCPRGAARRMQVALRKFAALPSDRAVARMLWYCGFRVKKARIADHLTPLVKAEAWWVDTL